jgi:hypothetical protein
VRVHDDGGLVSTDAGDGVEATGNAGGRDTERTGTTGSGSRVAARMRDAKVLAGMAPSTWDG